jgi:hypothetical protein
MRPLFTVHAGEFLVGQHIETSFKDKNVWVPTKDLGVDLLITNSANTKAETLQVKFSRDFLPMMKLESVTQRQLRSCTWFTLDEKHLAASKANHWVLVLLGFEKRSYDYLIIKPNELFTRLKTIHGSASGSASRYQTYVWVTKHDRAWLTRNLKRADEERIAQDTYEDKDRDVTGYLNDWSAIKDL